MTSTPAYPKVNQRRLQAPLHRTCPGISQTSDQSSWNPIYVQRSFAILEPFNQRLILALFEVLQFLPLLLPDMFRLDKDWDDLRIMAQYGTAVDRNDMASSGAEAILVRWKPVPLGTDPKRFAVPHSAPGSPLQPEGTRRAKPTNLGLLTTALASLQSNLSKGRIPRIVQASGNGTSNCWMKDASPRKRKPFSPLQWLKRPDMAWLQIATDICNNYQWEDDSLDVSLKHV